MIILKKKGRKSVYSGNDTVISSYISDVRLYIIYMWTFLLSNNGEVISPETEFE